VNDHSRLGQEVGSEVIKGQLMTGLFQVIVVASSIVVIVALLAGTVASRPT